MKIWSRLVGTLVMVMTLASALSAASQSRPTLAIVDFETMPAGSVLPPPHMGSALAGLMLDRLVASGQYPRPRRTMVEDRPRHRPLHEPGRGYGVREVCRSRLPGPRIDDAVLARRAAGAPTAAPRRAAPRWRSTSEDGAGCRHHRACRGRAVGRGRNDSHVTGHVGSSAAQRRGVGPLLARGRRGVLERVHGIQRRAARRSDHARRRDRRTGHRQRGAATQESRVAKRGSVADAAGSHTSYRERRAESASSRSSDSTTSRSACPHARYTGRHCSSVARPSAVIP